MVDVSQDYLLMDFLETVEYYSATGDGAWSAETPILNCSFFGQIKSIDGDDLRRTYAALMIRQGEWSVEFAATAPQRGDKFVFGGKTYFVESVSEDLVRLKQWVLRCYAI